ncbi:TPA: antirestriction protein [Enterobacter cloacae]|uniref:antirestriction protein n=1 Tax=Enterobacteriaceae TaxID=543 RepID=UPI00255045EE|nr:antirestriction protein [Enterobacter cloacae]
MHNDTTLERNNHLNHSQKESTEDNLLHAIVVPDEMRLSFWPQHFGSIPQWITLEPHIFAWMDRFCADYGGGIWRFYTLSNNGAFMAPDADGDEVWSLFNNMNGNGAEMSAEAAGIAVCLIAYSHNACRTECDAITTHYYRLRDYALQHPEAHAILRIID